MKIYINNLKSHLIIAPAKTGSSTVERMFQRRWNWDNVFIGKTIHDPKNLLQDYIEDSLLRTFKVFIIVRNPFDWIISGFRWMQHQNLVDYTHEWYPSTLTDHLIAMKNDTIKDNYWRNHCLFQPADFLRREYHYVKLENFKSFLKYLDRTCDSDYDKSDNYNINKNMFVPYPDISDFEKDLILELTRKSAILTNYNIQQSIDNYKQKYDSGELNEFLK